MKYTRGALLRDGGEGYIYEVESQPYLLMKIYKDEDLAGNPIVTPDLEYKLEYMKNNPPETLVAKGTVAWPLDLVKDEWGKLLGFVMPRLVFNEHLLRIYSYRHPDLDSSGYHKFPSIKSRISIGINLCSALHEFHKKGYIIGDFNHENIGVDYSTGEVKFMDCDSFHIADDRGGIFRTSVIMAGYLAPEIISHCQQERAAGRPYDLDNVVLPTFTVQSDYFCLALHLFKLLMNGVDPFRGIKSEATGSTASPFVGNEAIERNAYVFREGNKPSAVFCPPAESLPPYIMPLFTRAFVEGRRNPALRPTEAEWYEALYQFLSHGLKQCGANEKHQFNFALRECPYCIADAKHHKAQTGFVTGMYREEPQKVMTLSSDEIIRNSRKQTRKLHLTVSLMLWGITAIIYFGWNLTVGNLGFSLNPADWSGYEFLFIFAGIIECVIEIYFCKKELAVLQDHIHQREIDPKYHDYGLREYQTKLAGKITMVGFIAVVLFIISLVIIFI